MDTDDRPLSALVSDIGLDLVIDAVMEAIGKDMKTARAAGRSKWCDRATDAQDLIFIAQRLLKDNT